MAVSISGRLGDAGAILASAAALALLAAACSTPDPGPQRLLYTFRGSTMGTYYVVKMVRGEEQALSAEDQEEVQLLIDEELERVNGRMSTYRDDSQLSRFNHFRRTDPFQFDRQTFEVLAKAQEVSRLSEGAFDVTVGPLVNALGFGPDLGMPPPDPSPEMLAELRQRVGFEKLSLDADNLTVAKHHVDVYCDLSGIAKGYAVDRIAEVLAEKGFGDSMVEIGGEVRAAGINVRGEVWRLGIERPDSFRGDVQRFVSLADASLATSGDYRQYREVNGERLSHIVDPRTGRPISHRLASVSVSRPSCMVADALATALMVLGPEEGYELAVRDDVAALFLVREGDGFVERATPAFESAFSSAAATDPPSEMAR